MNSDRTRIAFLLLAAVFELLLAALAYIWLYARGTPLPEAFRFEYVLIGFVKCIPILILNAALYYFSIKDNRGSVYAEFFYGTIVPFCCAQNVVSALCIGIASGFGEELLFRGALQTELIEDFSLVTSLVITNCIFAYVHFIGVARKFQRLLVFYFLFGLYFSFLTIFGKGLWVAIFCHGFYNTMVILFIRYRFSSHIELQTSTNFS